EGVEKRCAVRGQGNQMNTHDIDIELPPLPEWVDWPVTVSEMSASEVKEAMQDYALAAIEADRKRRGEPVAFRVMRKTYDGRWVTDGRGWCDGAPSADLLADIAKRS